MTVKNLITGILLLCCAAVNTYAQTDQGCPISPGKKVAIQEIALQDTLLVSQIILYIQKSLKYPEFSKNGYIRLSIDKKSFGNENVLRHYYFIRNYYSLDEIKRDELFPQYYSWVGGRIVMIYIPLMNESVCYRYTKKSKKALQRKLEPFLPPKIVAVLPNRDGKMKRSKGREELIQFSGGKAIYIFPGESKAPVIMDTDHYNN